jgi:hypothetical protein
VSPLGHSPAASSSAAGGSATAPGGSAQPAPFSLINADSAGPSHQQLAVDLTASAGGTRDYLARDLRISFTALNTSVDTAPPDECTRRRPAS